MDWIKRMNEALAYMEDNLDGQISVEKAAQLACSSQYHFQRMFSYIIGVPLSEYLRRRRLTKAAFDLHNGEKVIDVALRYGYESPTAFNRAFQAVHGVSPSAAQKPDTALKAYPRVNFQITIQGVTEMEYRIAKKEAFRIVGVRDPLIADVEESFKRVPVFWQEVMGRGTIPQMIELANAEPAGLLGVCTCEGENEDNYYFIAVSTDKAAPEGMFEYTVPENTWAIFPGTGDSASVQELQMRIFSEWLPTSGYEWANAPDVEVYLDNDPKNMKYEVWLPIAKK
ncbi:MAG: AraC family transcriptional regulator [Oscillospiraceae bacterium]|nr:AraC family transcriptional regulator [Oscillospiraceae bacterium]